MKHSTVLPRQVFNPKANIYRCSDVISPTKYIRGVLFKRYPAGTSELHSACIHCRGSDLHMQSFLYAVSIDTGKKIRGKKNERRPSSVRLFSLSLLEKTLLTWFDFSFLGVFCLLKRLFKNSLIK